MNCDIYVKYSEVTLLCVCVHCMYSPSSLGRCSVSPSPSSVIGSLQTSRKMVVMPSSSSVWHTHQLSYHSLSMVQFLTLLMQFHTREIQMTLQFQCSTDNNGPNHWWCSVKCQKDIYYINVHEENRQFYWIPKSRFLGVRGFHGHCRQAGGLCSIIVSNQLNSIKPF